MSKHRYLNRVLLTQRPITTLSMDAGMFAQSVGLASLAIDLARLEWQRDKTSKRPPSDYLDAATELVNEASTHTGTNAKEVIHAIGEKRIREREVGKVTWVTWATFFDAASEPLLVTLKDGGKFLWNPIGSDKQRRAFLKKHFDRVGIEDAERPGIEQRWREAGVPPEMVRQLAVTRMAKNKLKGVKKPKAAEPLEGTSVSASRRGKEQPKARKKQARG
jgi:hypothetical protein